MGNAGFFLKDDLSIAGDARRFDRRKPERLVERVGVQRLRSSEDGGHGLDGRPDDVVVGVLRRQRPAGSLRVRPEQEALLLFGRKVFFDEIGPESSGGAHFGDFHVKVHADAPEKGEARSEVVDVETGFDTRPEEEEELYSALSFAHYLSLLYRVCTDIVRIVRTMLEDKENELKLPWIYANKRLQKGPFVNKQFRIHDH